MTIAAGFHFDGGILLCADTQFTSSSKTSQSKIFQIPHHAATLVLVLAGRYMFARRAIERITETFQALPDDQLSRGNIQDAIERGLRDVFEKHVYVHPDWGKENSPDFSFVIGLYSPLDGHYLLATEETICAELPDHVCLGSGSYLGDYLSRMYKGKSCPLQDIVPLSIYVLQQVKSYDAGCGEKSEFVVLWDDGDVSPPIQDYDLTIGESYSDIFTKCVSGLFYAAAELADDVEQLRDKLHAEVETLVSNNEIRKSGKAKYDEMTKALHQRVREILGGKGL